MRRDVSESMRRSIVGHVAIFALAGPAVGGLLSAARWVRLDVSAALSIIVWSYGLVLPMIACAVAGWICARACAWLYRGRRPPVLVHTGIGALSGLLSGGMVVLLLAIIGGWSMVSDRAFILGLLPFGLWAGGVCAVLAWLGWSQLSPVADAG